MDKVHKPSDILSRKNPFDSTTPVLLNAFILDLNCILKHSTRKIMVENHMQRTCYCCELCGVILVATPLQLKSSTGAH
jgi:hypothetical protein